MQAYIDKGHGLLTHAPTVQRMPLRLLLSIFVLDSSLTFFTRDISQAYVQSDTNVQRKVFVKPPADFDFPTNVLLRVDRPLYGLPEAGVH